MLTESKRQTFPVLLLLVVVIAVVWTSCPDALNVPWNPSDPTVSPDDSDDDDSRPIVNPSHPRPSGPLSPYPWEPGPRGPIPNPIIPTPAPIPEPSPHIR